MSAEPHEAAVVDPIDPPDSVLVVGTGLLGTSVAFALRRRGVRVHLVDRDATAARTAAELGAGAEGWPDRDPDLVVVGVPPEAVGAVVAEVQRRYPTSVVTDLSSVKAVPQRDVAALGGDLARFVGGHPLAGRERSGPQAARGDLFEGRPWVLTPTADTAADAVEVARALVASCEGVAVLMAPEEHDAAVALVSHAPHVVAAATAARLRGAAPGAVALSGQGVRDVTRIAASDPDLWVEILMANAAPVSEVLSGLRDDLDRTIAGLAAHDRDSVRAVLAAGNEGRSAIPGKHGGASVRYVTVPVVVPDEPGELGRLFVEAGAAGVNIEDVAIEHSPGQPVGLVELSVRPGAAATVIAALRAGGWTVQD